VLLHAGVSKSAAHAVYVFTLVQEYNPLAWDGFHKAIYALRLKFVLSHHPF
jgi:hypothetical protein